MEEVLWMKGPCDALDSPTLNAGAAAATTVTTRSGKRQNMGTVAVGSFEQQEHALVWTKRRGRRRAGGRRGRRRGGGDEEAGDGTGPVLVATARGIDVEAETLGLERSGLFHCG